MEGQIDAFETFENLYRSEYRAMLKHAARFGHRSHDVVHEAYEHLWAVMRTKDVENPRALLYKIAEHKALDGYDASKRRNAVEVPAGLSHDLAEIEEELASQRAHTADREEFTTAFDGALRALPGDERDAFILTDLRGLDLFEAGDVLGASHMTIHRRRTSARLTVREEIR